MALCKEHRSAQVTPAVVKTVANQVCAITVPIEETMYTLPQIISEQHSSPTTVSILAQFIKALDAALRVKGKSVVFRTHIYGVSAFCSSQKAFMFIVLRRNYVTALYYTGNAVIPGLEKANWLNSSDNAGSETLRIGDRKGVRQAVAFACAAYELAAKDTVNGQGVHLPAVPLAPKPKKHLTITEPAPYFDPNDLTI